MAPWRLTARGSGPFVDHALRLDPMPPLSVFCAVYRIAIVGSKRASTCWPVGWWPAGATRRSVGGRTVLARSGHNGCLGLCRSVARWTPRGGWVAARSGFTYLDDVARVMLDLAHRRAAAKEHGSSAGPPVSLLDQEVIRSARPSIVVGLPMCCVFALTTNGVSLPQSAETIAPTS